MIDIVDLALAVFQVNQHLHGIDNIVLAENARAFVGVTAKTAIKLHAADGRQVITIRGEEKIIEQRLRRIFCRWLAGTHHAVNLDLRVKCVARRIQAQGLGNKRAAIQVVGVNRVDVLDTSSTKLFQHFFGNNGVCF